MKKRCFALLLALALLLTAAAPCLTSIPPRAANIPARIIRTARSRTAIFSGRISPA